MGALAIHRVGLVTGVGLSAPAACAAMRCGLTSFVETRFMFAGEWLFGCPAPLAEPWRGREKLLQMATLAIRECLHDAPRVPVRQVPLLVCLAEEDRPGRLAGLDASFLADLQARLGFTWHPASAAIAGGRVGGVQALARARELLAGGCPLCLVAGVDSLLVGATLTAYDARRRLLTADNSDGFIPGEAAGALLVGPDEDLEALAPAGSAAGTPAALAAPGRLLVAGIGFGREPAPIESGEPLRAEGLTQAIRAALADGGLGYERLDYRLGDMGGAQYQFKEAALAMSRTLRVRKPTFDLWHPADSVGEVGAAAVPVGLALAEAAARKGFAPGSGTLYHCGNDDGARAALTLWWTGEMMSPLHARAAEAGEGAVS